MPQLNIDLLVNNQPAIQATRRLTDEVAKQEKAQQRAAAAAEKAAQQQVKAAERVAAQQQKAAERAAAQQQKVAEQAAAQQQKAAERAAASQIKESERTRAATERAVNAMLKDSERAAAARQRAAEKVAAAEIRAAEKAATAQQRAADKAAATQQKLADKAASDAEKSSAKMTKVYVGVAAAVTAAVAKSLEDINQLMAKAGQQSADYAAKFGEQRDQLAEIASIQGKTLDNQFTLDFAKFNVATGMRPDESLAYQRQLHNAGIQYSGKHLSEAEYAQYGEQAGRLGMAYKLSGGVLGNLAGSVLGSRNYNKFGEGASEQALADLNEMMAIVGHGKGENPVLADAVTKLLASHMNEEEFRGTFTEGRDIGALVSVIAEARPDEPEVYARAAIRGMQGEGAAPLREAAGITGNEPFLEQVKRVAPVIEAEARSSGTDVNRVIGKYFPDEREKVGMAALVNRGVGEGLIEERLAFGAQNRGPAAAFARIGKFEETETAQLRRDQAETALAEAQRGAENSGVAILREQALAELVRTKAIGTTATGIKDWMSQGGPLKHIPLAGGLFNQIPDPDKARINAEASRILERRMQAAGLGTTGFDVDWARSVTPEGREETLRGGIEAVRGAGRNPFSDVVRALDDNTKAMRGEAVDKVRAPLLNPRRAVGFARPGG